MALDPKEGYELAGRTQRVIDLLEDFRGELVGFAAKGEPFTAGDALLVRQAELALKDLRQRLQAAAAS